jgi:predicted nucleotidyltransferase
MKKDKNRQLQQTGKKESSIVRSSAAEYLTFVAVSGKERQQNDVEEQYNILTIGIFGSIAHDEAGEDSDVDVVVHISEPDLFMLAGIKNDLEIRFRRPVDIVTYQDTMNPFLKKIDNESVYV